MTPIPNGHSRQASFELRNEPQAHASSSKLPGNPQLGPEPFFTCPTPTSEQLEEELPPASDAENVPLGVLLDRVVRKSYGELRGLTEQKLPSISDRQKPQHIIQYARTTRQSILKYLAVLRWKSQVDVPVHAAPAQASFPTPQSNGSTDSPGYVGKGKGKEEVVRGKVTDARRIETFMKHQHEQIKMATAHLEHISKGIDRLRLRNPDLLTAMSILSLGTYPRLPTALTETFLPKPPLTNTAILSTLQKLNRHIGYRLRCVDYVPPDLIILDVRDGRVYVEGSHGQWRAELTIINFGNIPERWWLIGVEWGWREKAKGVNDPGGRMEGEERKAVLDLANMDVLSKGDAPLVRIHNFLQHLCLTYQLEVLYTQAMTLAGARWRGQLAVELDRTKKSLVLRYWLRPRPPPLMAGAVPKRPSIDSRQPMVGAILTISLIENSAPPDDADVLLAEIQDSVPSERLLRLKLVVKWQVGEIGEGGGWKVGDILNSSELEINPLELSISDILETAASTHAAHLTRHHCAPLLSLSRISIFPSNPPTLAEEPSLALRVPLPGQKPTCLSIAISTLTGLIEIEDEGATVSYDTVGRGMEDRGKRAKMACASVNEGKTRLGDDIGRLITAIITENIESQMRTLGYSPTRRLPLRSQDMAKADLHPASTIFLPLPTSSSHHLITKVTALGITFEVLQLVRVPAENGVGMKLGVGERTGVELGMIRGRRRGKRKRDGEVEVDAEGGSAFILEDKDLRDIFTYSNALVAQSIIESQLKSRQIPYTLSLPPTSGPGAPKSRSAIAGLVPTFTVNSADLLKDDKAGDVAMPRVYMQIKGWWNGGKCSAVTVVQLRHRSTAPTTDASPAVPTANTSSAKAEGITFDQASSVVRFQSDDLDHCVPGFLEQWERLSKVIVVAGGVNKINKLPQFKDVRMLTFDLRTATLEYYPGYICSITYDPATDRYVVSFGLTRAGQGQTPKTPGEGVEVKENPHEGMKGLLSWELNELVEGQKDVGVKFVGLLRATLPFLLETQSIVSQTPQTPVKTPSTPKTPSPLSSLSSSAKLVILSIRHYRLIWDTHGPPSRRFGVDFRLTPNDQSWIVGDAALSPVKDGRCGPLAEIPGFKGVIEKVWEELRTGGGGAERSPDVKREEGDTKIVRRTGSRAMKLDEGATLMVSGEAVGVAVKGVIREIDAALGGKR